MVSRQDDSDEPAESWLELVEDEPPQLLPFGEALPGSYDLYPCYEHYFHALLENAEIMRSQRPANHQLNDFLSRLEKYVRDQVMVGRSDYSTYNRFLEAQLQSNNDVWEAFQKYCRLYEQPELPLFVKSTKTFLQEPLERQVQTKQPEQQVTFERLVDANGYLPSLNLVLVGHVDHGKSTLLGRLIKEFGMEPVGQESLSSYTDIYEKEKQKGKTIEFSTCSLRTERCKLMLFDTPGHRNYMSNMIAALRLADIVVLVASAKKGEFESGMAGGTIGEILMIANSFGPKKLVVVASKMCTVQWDRASFNSIQDTLRKYIEKEKMSFLDLQFIPFDSLTNQNFKSRRYTDHETVTEWLNSLQTANTNKTAQDLRLPVFDVQQIYNTKYIFGKVEQGFLYRMQPITFYPNEFTTTVLSISQGESKVEFAGSGDFVSITVKNFDSGIERGTVACWKEEPTLADIIECELHAFSELLISGFQCVIHLHELIEDVQVTVESVQEGNRFVRRSFMRRGQNGIVRIRMLRGAVAFGKQTLDRFVLRNHEKTVASGRVLRSRRRTAEQTEL